MPTIIVREGLAGSEEMMKTSRILCLILATLGLVSLGPSAGRALAGRSAEEHASFENGNGPGQGDRAGQQTCFDIRDEIKRGQEFLKDKNAGYTLELKKMRVIGPGRRGRTAERVVLEKIVKPNFLLAVEDLKERRIRQVRITENGCVTKGFEVTKRLNNGVGSRFEIAYPENMVVLALRTMVRSGSKGYKEVVYTPYSPEIDTWNVRQAGLAYLTRQIELAHEDLRAKNVKLRAFDRLLEDSVPTQVSLVLSIIEHIDPMRFKHCQEGEETALVREVPHDRRSEHHERVCLQQIAGRGPGVFFSSYPRPTRNSRTGTPRRGSKRASFRAAAIT